MKNSERKIKKNIPFGEMPAQLRQLADALDGRAGELSTEWADLPSPIAKLEVKGKAQGDEWELKIKIKAEPIASLETQPLEVVAAGHPTPSPTGKSDLDYKHLKKQMKVAFKEIGASLAAKKRPEQDALETFLGASDLMMTFTGAAYGEGYYPAYRKACQALRTAYEIADMAALQAAYEALAQLKKESHQACK